MKAADHRRHQRPGDAGAKANIDLPGLLSLTLQQFILRRPQLLKDQARMLIKLSPLSVSATPWRRRTNN